jgi:hypothetical protein
MRITTLESDAKHRRKGVEVAILMTVLLLSLVLGWAVGKGVHNVGRMLCFTGIDPPRSGYVPSLLLVGLLIDIA